MLLFKSKAFAVGTFNYRRVGFVCSNWDFIKRAIVFFAAVVYTVRNRTFNRMISLTVIHYYSPFRYILSSIEQIEDWYYFDLIFNIYSCSKIFSYEYKYNK